MDIPISSIAVVVQCLHNLTKEEISLIRGLDGEAEKLRDTFVVVQSYLDDAQTKSITDAGVKTWLKKLEQKAYDADNTLDELNYQLLSNKRKKKTKASYFQRRQLSLRINEINTCFESINARAKDLGLKKKLAIAAPGEVSLETNSFTADPIFIGRDDDVLKIVEMLTNPTEEAVSILPIVGMGGLGKTTLARNVFNHQKIKSHFGQCIWVHVSQHFDAGVLFKKILSNLKSEKVEDGSSTEAVLKKLQEAMKATTYLLVLDDIWNEDQQKWDDFIKSWSGITSTKGNGIIVTTRSEKVGSLVKTLDMYLLSGLSDEQCWSIIKGRAVEGGSIITHDLEDIGKSIAKRCQGLPLAANVVGGVLRGKSPDEWRSIKDEWLSGDGEDYISKILKLSFHHLSTPSLKKCFAYCSIFPKGDLIYKVDLIELWMAEGFLQPDQTSDMETVGNKNFNNLLHNSLLQVVKRDAYGEVYICSMHDLVHDVASSILDSTYFKNIDVSSDVPKEQAKWYVYWGCSGDESSRIPKVKAKWLRTLIYKGGISDIVFSDFKSLHSLTLMDDDVEELPDSIRELIHLRYLDISYTSIRSLPNSIGKLFHLQTISSLDSLEKLPSTLKHLFNLRHLHVDDDTELPPYLGMLTSLQTLPCFKVRDEEGHRIVELESLKNLKGKLEIRNLEKVQGEKESEKACLFQKSGIVRLVLMWGEWRRPWWVRWRRAREGEINDENVLKGLQPHSNLKGLEIIGFAGSSFPSWWEALNNLMEIRLERCSECEEIPTMGQLPHLKSLYLSHMEKVKSLGASFYGIEECNGVCKETISVFPALKRLELLRMTKLTEWRGVEIPSGAHVEIFPCLEYLEIHSCEQLRSAPSQFTSLKELKIDTMDSGLPLASILCDSKLKTLTKLNIWFIKELICLPDWLFHNNQHLLTLNIRGCPRLRELPNGLHKLNSLEELTLTGCENLKSMPFPISGGEKLQVLTSLRKLTIEGCQVVLKNFVSEMEDSCVAPLLEDLYVGQCGDSDASSFNKVVDGILRFRSHSLLRLSLKGREDWESLPDQLQHLTSLSELAIICFGIEELPEWFGNLSSLKELILSQCRKLKHLPSVEAMRRLTKLTKLQIYDCPLLKGRGIETQSDDADSEWPNISHLPNIRVDWEYIRYNGKTRTYN